MTYCEVKSGVTLSLPYEGTTDYDVSKDVNGSKAHANSNTANRMSNVTVDNVTITNNGTIIIGGIINGGGGNCTANGHSAGKYSQLTLKSSTIENNGIIKSYGYIDEIIEESDENSIINNNSKGSIYIPFVVVENRGGSNFTGMYINGFTFKLEATPFNRFYMPNIYSKISTVHKGKIYGLADLYANDQHNRTTINLIGNDNTFLIQTSEKTIVDTKTTGQITKVDIYGDMILNSLSITVKAVIEANMSTADVFFPLSWYQNIHLFKHKDNTESNVSFGTQKLKIMPGSILHIHEGVNVTAQSIVVYDSSFDDVGLASSKYESDKGDGKLIVDGTLTINNIGGHVTTIGSTGKLVINTSATVDSKEVKSASTTDSDYNTWTYDLKLNLYNGVSVDSIPAKCGIDTYFAKDSGWASSNSEYIIEYVFILPDGYNDSSITNPNVLKYNILDTITLKNPTISYDNLSFVGWYIDESCQTPITRIKGTDYIGNIIIYGRIDEIEMKTVNYHYAIGEGIFSSYNSESTQNVVKDASHTVLGVPEEKIGYTFTHWECNGEVIKVGSKLTISDNVDLYAKYTINKYTISFEENGGQAVNDITAEYYSSITLPTPKRNDYTFKGWYTNSNFSGNPYTSTTMPGSNITLYANWEYSGCLIEGTLITMADGTQKKIEDINIGDEVLVFDHETGRYSTSSLASLVHSNESADIYEILTLNFSNNSDIRIVANHGLFDIDLRKYVFISKDNVNEYIGHRFSIIDTNGNSSHTTLDSYYLSEEYVKIYSPVSMYHLNIIANNLLTITPAYGREDAIVNIFIYDEAMKYDEELMKKDIEKYGLYTYEDFKDYLPYEVFNTSIIKYFKVSVGKGYMTYEDILYLYCIEVE